MQHQEVWADGTSIIVAVFMEEARQYTRNVEPALGCQTVPIVSFIVDLFIQRSLLGQSPALEPKQSHA